MVRQSQFADEFEKDLATTAEAMTPDLRQRKPTSNATSGSEKVSTEVEVEDGSSPVISLLDICRVIFVGVAIVFATSYYVTSGNSYIFGYPQPWWTKPARIRQYMQGPVNLTPEELLKYDGTDGSLPIYLSVNGTIFDVSAGSHTYGPGGSYHAFAGHDATRGYVTGCFMEDRTGDLRGAEEIYIPIDDSDESISSGERKTRAEKERREAKKKVQATVENWVNFYKNSEKYFEVGKLIGFEDEPAGPAPTLCAQAEKGRPKRKNMNKQSSAPGKPVP